MKHETYSVGSISNGILLTLTDVPTPTPYVCHDIYGNDDKKTMKKFNEHLLVLRKAGWNIINEAGKLSISYEDKMAIRAYCDPRRDSIEKYLTPEIVKGN